MHDVRANLFFCVFSWGWAGKQLCSTQATDADLQQCFLVEGTDWILNQYMFLMIMGEIGEPGGNPHT